MLDYLVLYNSQSGNTKSVAAAIFSALPEGSRDLIDIDSGKPIPEASTYFIGFCVHRGSCCIEVSDLLSSLENKNIALFGTCGMGRSAEYYSLIEKNVSAWINSSCRYLGCYICQGKMPMQVRQKYENMRTSENAPQVDGFIRNFDCAMTHPDREDLKKAQEFALSCIFHASCV
uniref:flavodoxin family protein BilS n=1 Tax=Lachnoclostridium phocaeense TaxID=1871021 RepID=UPI0026DD83CE|nr:flavodoxin family protein BilS [Lachnoclostridium phocaeense]